MSLVKHHVTPSAHIFSGDVIGLAPSVVKEASFKEIGAAKRPVGVFLGPRPLLRLFNKSSHSLTFPFIINSNAVTPKRPQHEEGQCQSKKRQAKGPFQYNGQKKPDAWLRVLPQPFKWSEKCVHNTLLVSLRQVGFILGAVCRMTPVRQVVATAGEDVHVAQDWPLETKGPLAAIIPFPTMHRETTTPFNIHVTPQIKGQKNVVTLLNCLRFGVAFKGCDSLRVVFKKGLLPNIVGAAFRASFTEIFIDLRIGKVRPHGLSKIKIKEISRAHDLLCVCGSACR